MMCLGIRIEADIFVDKFDLSAMTELPKKYVSLNFLKFIW